MLKRLYKFQNQDSFNNSEESLNELPHFVSLKVEEEEVDYKNYKVNPEDYIKPTSASVAADICIVDNSGNKYIVDGNSYSINLFPAKQYTPIGVVVVPASHTDDGTARIISLAAISTIRPDEGTTNGGPVIVWGGRNTDVPNLQNLTHAPYIADQTTAITSPQQIVGWDLAENTELCSDAFGTFPNPFDSKSAWGRGTTNKPAPSPYLEDGSRNELYHSTDNNGNNVLADMDGKGNTEKILAIDNSVSTDWQTAERITNDYKTQTLHPSAQCCWRYHTLGTKQGDWYLPAGGEMGYLAVRWEAINESIQKIIDAGFAALKLSYYIPYGSSSECSSNEVINLYFNQFDTRFEINRKDNVNVQVRAFLKVS